MRRDYQAIIKSLTGRSDPAEVDGISLLLSVREERALDAISDEEIASLVLIAESNYISLSKEWLSPPK